MRIAATVLLLCTTPAWAQSPRPLAPLAGMDWLIGGQWNSKAALPSGQVIESRIVVEFGPGQWSMRMIYFVKAKEGEYEQYETFFWGDPQGPGLQYITFSVQGSVIRGTGTVKDGVMTLEQAKTKVYPAMRSIYRRDAEDKDKYVGENFWNTDGKWKKVMTATCTRSKLSAPAKLAVAERRGKLDALKNFAGGEFLYYEKGKDAALGRHYNRFSLHGRLLVGWSFQQKDGKELPESLAVIWVDPTTREIRSLSVAANGTVTHGTARVEGKGLSWDTTDTPRKGDPSTSRAAVAWIDAHTYEMQFFNKVDGVWTLSPFTLVGKRTRKKTD